MKEGDRFSDETWNLYRESEQDYGESGDSEYGGRESSEADQEKRDFIEASITRAQTLAESLEWQLLMVAIDEKEKALGQVVIGNLDENGFLTCKVDDIAASQKVPIEEVEKVLNLIQSFEPAGVGARDLKECLLLQLENKMGKSPKKLIEWF